MSVPFDYDTDPGRCCRRRIGIKLGGPLLHQLALDLGQVDTGPGEHWTPTPDPSRA